MGIIRCSTIPAQVCGVGVMRNVHIVGLIHAPILIHEFIKQSWPENRHVHDIIVLKLIFSFLLPSTWITIPKFHPPSTLPAFEKSHSTNSKIMWMMSLRSYFRLAKKMGSPSWNWEMVIKMKFVRRCREDDWYYYIEIYYWLWSIEGIRISTTEKYFRVSLHLISSFMQAFTCVWQESRDTSQLPTFDDNLNPSLRKTETST